MTAEFLWNSSKILTRILVETSVANTSDDFEILQEFRSEFFMKMQLTQLMTIEFLSNFDKNVAITADNVLFLQEF